MGVPDRKVVGLTSRPAKLANLMKRHKHDKAVDTSRYWPFYAERNWIHYLHLEWKLEDALRDFIFVAKLRGLKTKEGRAVIKKILYTVDFSSGYKAKRIVKPTNQTLKGMASRLISLLQH